LSVPEDGFDQGKVNLSSLLVMPEILPISTLGGSKFSTLISLLGSLKTPPIMVLEVYIPGSVTVMLEVCWGNSLIPLYQLIVPVVAPVVRVTLPPLHNWAIPEL
jgi:hypothetical protein